MPADEIKGVARVLYALGFPIGLIAVVGAFSIGMAIFQGEISFTSKRFVLGAALLSFSMFALHFSKVYRPSAVFNRSDDKVKWVFSWSALFWVLCFGLSTYYLGTLLIPMLKK